MFRTWRIAITLPDNSQTGIPGLLGQRPAAIAIGIELAAGRIAWMTKLVRRHVVKTPDQREREEEQDWEGACHGSGVGEVLGWGGLAKFIRAPADGLAFGGERAGVHGAR